MSKMRALLREFVCDESGQATFEYANVIAWVIISFGVVLAVAYAVQTGYVNIMANSIYSHLHIAANGGPQ